MNDPTFPDTAAQTGRAMGDQAHAGIERVAGTAHDTVERVATAASSAAHRVGAVSQEWMAAKDEWLDTARVYVREHPFAALGIAVSAGYLLSRLLSR